MPQHLACIPGDRASYAHLTDEGRSPGKASCLGGGPDAAWTDSPARPVPARRPPCGTTSHHLAGEKAQLFHVRSEAVPTSSPCCHGRSWTGQPVRLKSAALLLVTSIGMDDIHLFSGRGSIQVNRSYNGPPGA